MILHYELHIDDDFCKELESNRSTDRTKLRKVIERWIADKKYNASWEKLISALNEIGGLERVSFWYTTSFKKLIFLLIV